MAINEPREDLAQRCLWPLRGGTQAPAGIGLEATLAEHLDQPRGRVPRAAPGAAGRRDGVAELRGCLRQLGSTARDCNGDGTIGGTSSVSSRPINNGSVTLIRASSDQQYPRPKAQEPHGPALAGCVRAPGRRLVAALGNRVAQA